jgi:predicted enzyme related to lactoylglutathione lyase
VTFTGVSPVLLSSDLDRSIGFYEDGLGFTGERYGEGFAIVARDGQSIFLALTDKPIVPHWHIVEMMWNAYVRVDDVDAYYAEVRDRGTEIDYDLYDAPHGMREFGITDPDGHDVAFGQPIDA